MYILGISCFYHDAAAALINDGQLTAAAAEERFSRLKHDSSFPKHAVQFCLKQAGIHASDLDYVVFYEKPFLKFTRILLTTLHTFPRSAPLWNNAMSTWLKQKLWIKSYLQQQTGIPARRILFCDHHTSHAASAFFASPFKQAAVLTVDGVGEWTTTALGSATSHWKDEPNGKNKINLFEEQRFPHSLGLLYSMFTAWLGFRVNNGEYKVMGMSSYGTPKYVEQVEKVIQRGTSGSFCLDLDYIDFHRSIKRSYSQKFMDLFGPPRQPESDFFTAQTNPDRSTEQSTINRNQYYADVAASVQQVLEDTLIEIANYLYNRTAQNTLVMAGGVALNTKANYRLLTETSFENIYIQPAAGDDGGALGAALWAYHCVLNQPRNWTMPHAYWGASYTDEEYAHALDTAGVKYTHYTDDSARLDRLTDAILNQKVIALMQDRFEWGPRALGNRSILADPRYSEMKTIVNTKIKYREPFRPFAPVILRKQSHNYIDYAKISNLEASRYMLLVAPIQADKKDDLQAVNHQGTARPQIIDRHTNPNYYSLVERFGQATGVPVLLNTSFNLRGEPIVNTPQDALSTFYNSDIDILSMGAYLVSKTDL